MSIQINRRSGFTLIELLVVIAILGLIVSLVGPSVMRQFSKAKSDTASLQISDFGAGLDLFFLDMGRYPTTSEGLQALLGPSGPQTNWNGPYLKKPKIPFDPWGEPYRYKAPGEHGPYDLSSLGADQALGGEGDNADITSWQ